MTKVPSSTSSALLWPLIILYTRGVIEQTLIAPALLAVQARLAGRHRWFTDRRSRRRNDSPARSPRSRVEVNRRRDAPGSAGAWELRGCLALAQLVSPMGRVRG